MFSVKRRSRQRGWPPVMVPLLAALVFLRAEGGLDRRSLQQLSGLQTLSQVRRVGPPAFPGTRESSRKATPRRPFPPGRSVAHGSSLWLLVARGLLSLLLYGWAVKTPVGLVPTRWAEAKVSSCS